MVLILLLALTLGLFTLRNSLLVKKVLPFWLIAFLGCLSSSTMSDYLTHSSVLQSESSPRCSQWPGSERLLCRDNIPRMKEYGPTRVGEPHSERDGVTYSLTTNIENAYRSKGDPGQHSQQSYSETTPKVLPLGIQEVIRGQGGPPSIEEVHP